jgi:hypothetical protein
MDDGTSVYSASLSESADGNNGGYPDRLENGATHNRCLLDGYLS